MWVLFLSTDDSILGSYHAGGCKCWSISQMIVVWVPIMLVNVSVGPFWYDYRIGSYMIRCKCWVKTYMMARPTTSMKEGYLYRTSYDKKNHEIAHMMMTRWDPDRAMIHIQLWWLQEIHIKWWSKSSSDDPYRVMMSIDDSDRVMIHIHWWSILSMIQWRWSK